MTIIDDIRRQVEALLKSGSAELEELEVQNQKEIKLANAAEKIRQELTPLLEQVEALIAKFKKQGITDSDNFNQLKAQREVLKTQIKEAVITAEEVLEEELLQEEERLLAKQGAEDLKAWRMQVRDELIELIEEQEGFYDATDTAIPIKGYADDLKEIGALEEVVDKLIEQINRYDRKKEETGVPTARLRGTYAETLLFIADLAMKNRQGATYPQAEEFTAKRTKPTSKPVACEGLSGKVVVVGGHDRLETAVRNRLSQSDVELSWATSQTGPGIWTQVATQVPTADLVIVLTGYASHTLTDHVMGDNKTDRHGKSPTYLTTTGMTRLVEAIEVGLKTQQLSQQFGGSRAG